MRNIKKMRFKISKMIFFYIFNVQIFKNMRKLLILFSLLLSISSFSQDDLVFDGVKIKTSIKVDDGDDKTKLILNGAGIRDKMWINLYVQALYLTTKSTDPQMILDADETIATRLHVTSSLVSKKKLIEAIEEGIVKSYKGDLNAIKDRMHTFMGFFETQIEKEGYVDMVYSSNTKNTSVYINKKFIGSVPGKDFRKALFGIWLEENCVDKTLRKRLLGL